MKIKLLLLVTILALSCNNDDTNTPDNTALNLVTGIDCRQTFGDVGLQLGNPNVLVNDKFIIYPNPANEVVFLSSLENVSDVWLVKANPEKIYQNTDFSTILIPSLYAEQSIFANSDFALNGQSSNSISLNIGALEKGYYRVFVKIGGMVYWDNLYKYDNQGNNEAQFNAILNFWN